MYNHSMGNKRKPSAKNKKSKIWIIIPVSIVAVTAAAVAIIMLSNRHIFLEDVKEYCRTNSYSTSNFPIDTSRLGNDHLIETTIVCQSSINKIQFSTFYEPIPENWFTDSMPSDGSMITLGEGKNYLKIYYDPNKEASSSNYYYHKSVTYGILDEKELITVTSPDEATARRVLIEIGYPDKEWYTGQR